MKILEDKKWDQLRAHNPIYQSLGVFYKSANAKCSIRLKNILKTSCFIGKYIIGYLRVVKSPKNFFEQNSKYCPAVLGYVILQSEIQIRQILAFICDIATKFLTNSVKVIARLHCTSMNFNTL